MFSTLYLSVFFQDKAGGKSDKDKADGKSEKDKADASIKAEGKSNKEKTAVNEKSAVNPEPKKLTAPSLTAEIPVQKTQNQSAIQ